MNEHKKIYLRLPVEVIDRLDAMAARRGNASRASVVRLLLELGLEQLENEVSR